MQFYFTGSRATAYAKYPGEKNWLFDENMKPLVNNPAWVRAIQDVIDALPSEPADQINADPGTTAFQQFLTGTGSVLEWWGDIGTSARTSDTSTIGDVLDFDLLPASDDVYNFRKGQWKNRPAAQLFAEHGLSGLGHLCDEDGRQRSEAPESGVERCGSSRRQGPLDVDVGLSVRLPALSEEPHKFGSVGAGRIRQEIHRLVHEVPVGLHNHPNSAIEPRIPGIFQYYSIAEDELQKTFAGKQTAQQGADNVAAAWDKLTDKLGRDNQVKYYRISMGIT